MSQSNLDPYQPPTIGTGAVPTGSEIDTLRNVAFWQRFFSVLGYVVSGIAILAFTVQTFIAASSLDRAPAMIGGLITLMMFGGLTVVVYVIPSILLGSAAQATRDLGEGRITLGDYASKQKKFWRYVGMMVSIVLCIYLVILALLLVLGLTFAGVQMSRP